MSYIVLARKYRPQTFAEVYAQEHVTDILQNAIRTNRISHAFLFTGPRGVGKTSMARIMAKSLNCVEGPTVTPCNKCHNCLEITASTSSDVIEIDGASNNGVDNIRDLQSELMYAPSTSRYKIYIIDEVHMLSTSAFNALLKTLEEPPDNVIFIFATTEPHKVLPTIISRCQRYDFKRIPVEAIVARIQALVKEEGIKIDSESIYLIARKADGGLRDALSLMDQVLSYCLDEITIQKVREIFGLLPSQVFANILRSIHSRDAASIIRELHIVLEQGTEIQELMNNLLDFLRVTLLRKIGVSPSDINPDEYPIYDEIAALFNQNELMYITNYLIQTKIDIRTSLNPQLILEVVMIKLSRMDEMNDLSEIIGVLDALKGGAPIPVSTSSQYSSPVKPTQQPQPRPQYRQSYEEQAPMPDEPAQDKIDLTTETLKESWQRIANRLHKISQMTSTAFKLSAVAEVNGDKVKIAADSTTHASTISKNIDNLVAIFEDIFGKKVKFEILQPNTPTPTSMTIKRTTVEDVKAVSPELAQFIELTGSKLTSR